ncbi:MAG TPA: cupin domain-containing protein [Candidatus Limnocylindria bacterium]|nr:cupin domain-containing protein [Candidatus Limnocylindria bacterium]
MLLPLRVWTREEMLKRVARFADLKGFSEGLQDSALPESQKTTYNVIGFQTPEDAGSGGVNSPVGADASANAAIPISEGFNLGFVKCRPGKGVLMHNHDTNETFVVMSGRWRVQWNEGPDMESLEIGPLDTISIPAGCARRFENITAGEPAAEHLLLFVIGGDAPRNEFTAASMRRVEEFERTGR